MFAFRAFRKHRADDGWEPCESPGTKQHVCRHDYIIPGFRLGLRKAHHLNVLVVTQHWNELLENRSSL